MKLGDKLFIVTRRDIAPGYQAVQSVHAQAQFAIEHAETFRRWYMFSNYLALLSVADEPTLLALAEAAHSGGAKIAVFHEPDVGGAVTAIAIEPCELARELCKNLPLALKGAHEK